jgi:putative oxidoreductase
MFGPNGVLSLVGRILLALIFVVSGSIKLGGWSMTAGYMASKGMPMVPLLLGVAITIEILGGLSVALGLGARVGAAVLAIYLIPVTLIFHDFWAAQGADYQMQLANFLKNVSIIGGLTLVVTLGPGGWSLDGRRA